MNLKGIVLAGGKSSRFGEDKALARWEGETLIERAVNLLAALDLSPEVIASRGKNYQFLNRRIHNDIIPEKGPLGGLCTAFSIFSNSTLLVLTCDMPFLTRSVLEDLIDAHRSSGGSVIFEGDRTQQPFPGIYLSKLHREAEECLAASRLSMKNFLSRIPGLRVLPRLADPKVFWNVNTLADLSAPIPPGKIPSNPDRI